jgi:small subunit ribosomal protein S2
VRRAATAAASKRIAERAADGLAAAHGKLNMKECVVATVESSSPSVGVRDLLEAGLHFGHQTKRWNPKMKRYIFDKRNGIHIIDLAKSLALLQEALGFLHNVAADGKEILFVGTKKQAQQIIKETAEQCNQGSVTHRWLGGTLTNRRTISNSIRRMKEMETLRESEDFAKMHKQEASRLNRELAKLQRNLSGVADMRGLPAALFVVDINREAIAVAEANRLGIPVVAIVDTNCNPDAIDYVIPGNDDAIRAIKLICGLIGETIGRARAEYEKRAAELARKAAAEEAARKAAEAIKQEAAAPTAEEAAGAKPQPAQKPRKAPAKPPREKKTEAATAAAGEAAPAGGADTAAETEPPAKAEAPADA